MKMSQPKNVNTAKPDKQANRAPLPLLQLKEIRQQLSDIDELALTAQTLGEIAFEIIDATVIIDPAIERALTRIDALTKATYRAAISIQEAAVAISLLLEDAEGSPA